MTELREHPQQPAGAPAAASAEPDPLHNLYRMSRTAGLGSGDYVAINNTSVLAFLLGLAGVLALLSPMMVIVPVAALICGVLAQFQIRSSNGTQTGQAFAALGILLGLVFGGISAANSVRANIAKREDAREVAQAVKSLSDLISTGQYAQAYQALFSDDFKEQFPEDVFTTRWENVKRSTGDIKSITWGGRAEFETVKGTNTRRGYTKALFNFDKMQEPSPVALVFVEQDGEWMLGRVGELFDPVQERNQEMQSMDPRRQGPSVPTGPGR
jgi:hypothetical protein